MAIDIRDRDGALVPLFKHVALENTRKTAAEGRKIFDDVEIVEIRVPGSRDVKVFKANDLWNEWHHDPYTGEQHKITYAQRFPHQYRQFVEKQAQTVTGTPLQEVPFLTEAWKAMLRSQNIYIIEQLAAIDGEPLKNLGPGGRELKNRAAEYIAQSRTAAPGMREQADREADRVRMQILEEDNELLKKKLADMMPAKRDAGSETRFEDMSDERLIEWITTAMGTVPKGNNDRKTLLRMAADARARASKAN